MKIIADLHIHSAYSRGCSKELTLKNIAKWCRYKGIDLVSTGDFTYPAWMKSIKQELAEAEPGFYVLKSGEEKTRFVIGTEISCVYMQGGRCRRVHICVLAPSIEAADKLSAHLVKRGCNLKSDGRPIIGLSSKELAEICWQIDPAFFIFPAHAWTPWYAIFGSKSGFDSLKECFEELSGNIIALETGLSSDPSMNHRVSMLDGLALLSNSDAHSLGNLGREANVFEFAAGDLSFSSMIGAISGSGRSKFASTIEFFPEAGKYHIDGHAVCGYYCEPEISRQTGGICPQCGKKTTVGVLSRVRDLEDRRSFDPEDYRPYQSLVPLIEIIAIAFNAGRSSKKVANEYLRLVGEVPEFSILLDLSADLLMSLAGEKIASLILATRRGQVSIKPGYDGVYGKVLIKPAK